MKNMKKMFLVIGVCFILIGTLWVRNFQQASRLVKAGKEITYLQEKEKTIQQERNYLSFELEAKSHNTETIVVHDTDDFLRAFFIWDTSKGEQAWTNVGPFVTDSAKKKLTPMGTNQAARYKTKTSERFESGIKKMNVYYTPIDDTHANVFARVWQTTTLNKVTSTVQMLLDLSLVYDAKTGRWLVDNVSIQQPLASEGHIS